MLHPTPEFRALARRMCQDIDIFARTEEELYAWVLGDVTSSNANKPAEFLDKVLDPARSSSDVAAVWKAAPSDVFFKSNADIRQFLTEVRSQLAKRHGV